MLFIALGVAGAGVGIWTWTAQACMKPVVTLSTQARCFRVRSSPLTRAMPLPGCVGGRATYRAAEWDGDEPGWESLECLSEWDRAAIEAELETYLLGRGFEAYPGGVGWTRVDRHVRLKMLGVVGAPTAVQIRVEEKWSEAPSASLR